MNPGGWGKPAHMCVATGRPCCRWKTKAVDRDDCEYIWTVTETSSGATLYHTYQTTEQQRASTSAAHLVTATLAAHTSPTCSTYVWTSRTSLCKKNIKKKLREPWETPAQIWGVLLRVTADLSWTLVRRHKPQRGCWRGWKHQWTLSQPGPRHLRLWAATSDSSVEAAHQTLRSLTETAASARGQSLNDHTTPPRIYKNQTL